MSTPRATRRHGIARGAKPRTVVTDYAGMIEGLRVLKDYIGLSNGTIDTLCGWVEGHCDKVLGPAMVRGLGKKTFGDLLWVLGARITVELDLERANQMAEHWEKRATCINHRPNRVSKQIIAQAKPLVMREFGSIGGRVTLQKMTDAERSAFARKAARARWRGHRKRKRKSRRRHNPVKRTELQQNSAVALQPQQQPQIAQHNALHAPQK